MKDEFYSTLAHVLPILLLAFIWDSGFLSRLRQQERSLRRVDPSGVRFWTKPRVRAYTLIVSSVVVVSTAVSMLVLAGVIPDSYALRVVLSVGLIIVLATLMTRISVDVFGATGRMREAAGHDGEATAAGTQPDREPDNGREGTQDASNQGG